MSGCLLAGWLGFFSDAGYALTAQLKESGLLLGGLAEQLLSRTPAAALAESQSAVEALTAIRERYQSTCGRPGEGRW
jgi:hypothetical protein